MKKWMNISLPFYTKLAMILVSIIALGYICVAGKFILCPLLFAFLLAKLLLPFAAFLERKTKLPRGAASALSLICLVICAGGVLFLIGTQVTHFARDWPQFQQHFADSVLSIHQWVDQTFHINIQDQMNYLDTATNKIKSASTTMIGATVLSVSSVLLFLVFVLIETFFILQYRRHLKKFTLALFAKKHAPVVYDIIEQVQNIVRKYLLGLMLQILIVSALCFTAFSFIEIEYALLLGVIAGILNIIPYIGILTAFVFTMFLSIGAAASATELILVAGSMIGIHLVDSNFLLPMVVGSKVKINPLITLLGVILGEMLWGIPGMFLSIPVIAIIKIIFDRVEAFKPWGYLLGEEDATALQPPALHKEKEEVLQEAEAIKPGEAMQRTDG